LLEAINCGTHSGRGYTSVKKTYRLTISVLLIFG
jgi:hypothetical protein